MTLIRNHKSRSRSALGLMLTAAAVAIVQVSADAAAPQSGITGRWVNPAHSVIIDIAPCGGALCGTVRWASAKARSDAAAATGSLVGTRLLTGLHRQGSRWEGEAFVPDRNIHVEARIERAGPGQLKVSGCALGGLVCDSQLWTRTKGKLPPR